MELEPDVVVDEFEEFEPVDDELDEPLLLVSAEDVSPFTGVVVIGFSVTVVLVWLVPSRF